MKIFSTVLQKYFSQHFLFKKNKHIINKNMAFYKNGNIYRNNKQIKNKKK